jgi:hypothetical protein
VHKFLCVKVFCVKASVCKLWKKLCIKTSVRKGFCAEKICV